MFGNINVNAIFLLLLAFEQDWLDRVDQRSCVSANAKDLLDSLHYLFTFHLLELGLSDWHDETHVATVCEKHFDCEIVNALRQVIVGTSHTW